MLLASCSGVTSTPDIQKPDDKVPPKTQVANAEFTIVVADDGTVTTQTSKGDDFTGSQVTPDDSERQLLSGIEVVLEDLKVTHDNQQVNVQGTFANNMEGYVIHGLSLVVEATNTAGAVAKNEFKFSDYTVDTVGEKSFLAFEEGFAADLKLDLVGKLATVTVQAFADTANHYIVDTEYTGPTRGQLATQQFNWNFAKKARTAAELADYIRNAGHNDVVSFTDETQSLEITQTIEVSTKLLVSGGSNVGTGQARMVELIASDSFVGSIFHVTQKGELNLANVVIMNAKTSAILNDGKLYIQTVQFLYNRSHSASQGGAIQNNGELIIFGQPNDRNSVVFEENQAGSGGAIYNSPDGKISIGGGTKFWNNVGTGTGGAITNWGEIRPGNLQSTQVSFADNQSSTGGALHNMASGTAEFENVKFKGNKVTTDGGAIYNFGQLEIRNSIFDHNQVTGGLYPEGGAIYNRYNMDISGSQFTRNVAARGAAISTCGPSVVIRSSIMMYNSFPDDHRSRFGLGIYVRGSCGTLNPAEELSTQQNSDLLELHSVTIWNNNGVEAQNGSGIYISYNANVSVHNSIIAMNKGGKAFMSDVDGDPNGLGTATFTSTNSFYSYLDTRKFPLGSGDIASENPLSPLDPLITVNDAGWPVPAGNSLAVNAGDCDNTLTTDIRGEARESGSGCDMGAVELTAAEIETGSGLDILGVGPKDAFDTQFIAELTPGKPRLEVYGSVDTVDLKTLRYSLNYADFESINLSRIKSDGSFTILELWTAGAERVALRTVANGLNNIKIEAEYNNGSIKTVRQDFIVLTKCDRGGLLGTNCVAYANGPTPVITIEEKPDFLYYERSTLDLNNFTIKVSVRCSCPNDFEEFSYRINNNPAISIPRERLVDALDDEGKYHIFTIDVSNLPKGENGIVIGVRAFDVDVYTTVLHLNIQ